MCPPGNGPSTTAADAGEVPGPSLKSPGAGPAPVRLLSGVLGSFLMTRLRRRRVSNSATRSAADVHGLPAGTQAEADCVGTDR